jgi:hypothetical protein
LVGSGYFYDDPHIGNRGRIGSQKKQFIEAAQTKLEPTRHAGTPSTT